MVLEFFDIPVDINGNKFCLMEVPECVYIMSFFNDINIDDFKKKFKDVLEKDVCIDINFELDKKYFILKNHEEPYGVISLHKGYTFIDRPEGAERIIIKCGFSEMDFLTNEEKTSNVWYKRRGL